MERWETWKFKGILRGFPTAFCSKTKGILSEDGDDITGPQVAVIMGKVQEVGDECFCLGNE